MRKSEEYVILCRMMNLLRGSRNTAPAGSRVSLFTQEKQAWDRPVRKCGSRHRKQSPCASAQAGRKKTCPGPDLCEPLPYSGNAKEPGGRNRGSIRASCSARSANTPLLPWKGLIRNLTRGEPPMNHCKPGTDMTGISGTEAHRQREDKWTVCISMTGSRAA